MGARHVVIVGAMGSGKTTVGRRLAERLDRPFLDNDAAAQARVGMTVRELEEREGIDAVHRLEADVLRDALRTTAPAVIPAAASVVDDDELRQQLRDRGVDVVWLRAPSALLRERASGGTHRPDVGSDPGDAAVRLDVARQDEYADVADLAIDVAGKTPDEIATEIANHLMRI